MIWLSILLTLTGLVLSALFSGAETGFYRQSKIRFLLDARSGDRVAQGLMLLINRPALFVATALVGNNLANYMVSLALVLAGDALWSGGSLQQLLGPLVMSPVLFVYGELLPKHVFYLAPNHMLRRVGVPLLAFAIAFIPVSGLLWAAGWLLEKVAGASRQRIGSTLARRELQQVFEEGHDVGVLFPTQRQLVQGLFSLANDSVSRCVKPVSRFSHITSSTTNETALRQATSQHMPVLLVEDSGPKSHVIGYSRTVDAAIGERDKRVSVRSLLEIDENESLIGALRYMQTAGEDIALIVGDQRQPRGVVLVDDLVDPLMRGGV